jgi:hypothetical protein
MPTDTIEQEILKDVLNNPGDTFYENVISDFLDEQGIEHDFRKLLNNNLVTELKPYQEKCLHIWVNHWKNICFCTKSTDESKAEQYFYDFYKQLGFSKPKSIVWVNNPYEMYYQSEFSNKKNNNETLIYLINQIWNQIRSQAWNQMNWQIRDRVWKYIGDNNIWNRIGNKVYDYIWNQIGEITTTHIYDCLSYGQQNANRFAFYAYCMQLLRIESYKSLILYMLLAQEVNWWCPTEQTVFVTRKPKECVIKDNQLIKLVYQDGYTIT